MANELVHKAAEILGQLQALSPKMADVALAATRADAIANLSSAALWFAICTGAGVFIWRKVIPWGKKPETDEFIAAFTIIGFGGIALIVGVIALIILTDPWNYIALAHPELWIAHKIMGAA